MKYKEYLNAARKHKNTCLSLIACIDELNNSPQKDLNKIKSLTLNLYYLSGYIIECSVKYAIYVCIQYNRFQEVNKLNNEDITYKDHIKHHKYSRYVDHLNRVHGGIVLLDNRRDISKEIIQLYNGWDADIRYCYNDIPSKFKYADNFGFVKTFNQYAEDIFNFIQKEIR
jgi:hypothetical protein